MPKNEQKYIPPQNVNTKLWEKIFDAVEAGVEDEPIKLKDAITQKFKNIRSDRNDLFTDNIKKDNELWKIFPILEHRNMLVAKPLMDGDFYDDRVLFIVPYTTVKKNDKFIELYYCIIETPFSNNEEIFNFSILSGDEINKFYGIDMTKNKTNIIDYVSDIIVDNLEDITTVYKNIKDKKTLSNIIKGYIKPD